MKGDILPNYPRSYAKMSSFKPVYYEAIANNHEDSIKNKPFGPFNRPGDFVDARGDRHITASTQPT